MNRSKLLSASTLIALALLLSAGQSERPTPSPRPTPESNKGTQFAPEQSAHQPAPAGAAYLVKTPNNADPAVTKEENGSNTPTVVIAIFAIVSGLAAIAIAYFNYQLVGVTRDMHEAAKAATEVAKQNVEVSRLTMRATRYAAFAAEKNVQVVELALNAERPFIFVESQMMVVEDTPIYAGLLGKLAPEPDEPTMDLTISFDLRNRGKGPAIIKQVAFRLLMTEGIGHDDNPQRHIVTIGKTKLPRLPRTNVISGGESESGATVRFTMLKRDWDNTLKMHVYLMLIGLVTYRDVFKRTYTTRVFFGFHPPPPPVIATSDRSLRLQGHLFIGADRHNRFT